MDKKEFKKITKEVYEKYGFKKKGNLFYLDLDEVLLCSKISYCRGVTYLAYNFSIKAAHSVVEYRNNDMFEGFESHEILIYYTPAAEGYHKQEIPYENLTAEEYAERLSQILPRYFEPYKKNALKYIERCYREKGLVIENDIIMISLKARQYLGIVD